MLINIVNDGKFGRAYNPHVTELRHDEDIMLRDDGMSFNCGTFVITPNENESSKYDFYITYSDTFNTFLISFTI